MRVVLDTNVFISGLFFDEEPRDILDLIEKKIITPCFIIATFSELQKILSHPKFQKQRKRLSFSVDDFLGQLKIYSLLFPQPSKIPSIIKEDLADNYFLACALISGANFIVSGDQHLLKLKIFRNIFILTPKQFLNRCKQIDFSQRIFSP